MIVEEFMPQLRVRTEYSFRRAYGSPARVAEVLAAAGCPAAGIVERAGTWSHVTADRALRAAGVTPMFGAEFVVPGATDHGKPTCWALATDLRAFYRLSSSPPESAEGWAEARGVVRFAGAALTDPETFDFVDLNPLSARRRRAALALARRTGKPLALTSDVHFPALADRERFLAWDDSLTMAPQHIASVAELRAAMPDVDEGDFRAAVAGAYAAAERVGDQRLNVAPIISVPGDLRALVEEGRQDRLARGHIAEWTEEYAARLERELVLIEEKAYASYFLVVADMVVWAKERMLVGPARGSSAGSLVCFLLQITEVDPLVHGLIFERFIDVNRDDLPDIDIDFNDQKRHLVFDYLAERYGSENIARIGSINRLAPRSVVAHVGKKLGVPRGATFPVINALVEYSSGDARYGHGLEDTLSGTQPGRDFSALYPEARLMGELEHTASHSGQHAAGIIVSNVPVVEFCTVRDGIAQIDKKDAEALNLLKIDALGLRTLGVIEDTGCVTPRELYDLKFDDPEVLDVLNDLRFSGVFQFEGAAQRSVSSRIRMERFQQIDHVTALARPGPLGGGAAHAYSERSAGREAVAYRHPSMDVYLGETLGVVLYQEQVMKIVRELGGFSWEDTSTIRKAMSGRKGQEFFDRYGERFAEGAARRGIDADTATQIWNEICGFGAWGMNKSHTASYAMISYWCCWMKRYHPLEYAAACLRHAKDDEQTVEILRELTKEGVDFEPFDAELSQANWVAVGGRLLGGYTNLVGVGPVKAANFIRRRDCEGGLTEKDRSALAKLKPKHDDLRPAHTMWDHIYRNPSAHNIHGALREFGTMENRENGVVICKLIRLERRDENEGVRVARRNGEVKTGLTQFLDAFVVDDSVTKPIRLRLRPRMWRDWGEPMADRAVLGQDWFLVRGDWLEEFSMMIVKRIKCLTNPEVFR